jgi:hypothetical protein
MVSPDSEEEEIGIDEAALCGLPTAPLDGCGCPAPPPPLPPPLPPPCPDLDWDGICDYEDICWGTVEDFVPRLAVNHFALFDVASGVFDTIPPGGPERLFTTYDTGGCSCEQILHILGGRFGQYRNGCSFGTMKYWVRLVNGGFGPP